MLRDSNFRRFSRTYPTEKCPQVVAIMSYTTAWWKTRKKRSLNHDNENPLFFISHRTHFYNVPMIRLCFHRNIEQVAAVRVQLFRSKTQRRPADFSVEQNRRPFSSHRYPRECTENKKTQSCLGVNARVPCNDMDFFFVFVFRKPYRQCHLAKWYRPEKWEPAKAPLSTWSSSAVTCSSNEWPDCRRTRPTKSPGWSGST